MTNTPHVPATRFDFSNSPSFCKNGDANEQGKIIHVANNETVISATQGEIPVTQGGLLYRSEVDGTLAFYSEADFITGFSRLLNNGALVPMSEDLVVQVYKARKDPAHLGDIGRWGAKRGQQGAQILYDKALKSDAGLAGREKLDDLKKGIRDFKAEAKEATQENLGATIDAISASKVAEKARGRIAAARRMWGAFTNNHS